MGTHILTFNILTYFYGKYKGFAGIIFKKHLSLVLTF